LHAVHIASASEANFTARDRNLLAATPYKKATIPESYQRHIVEYHRKEGPGTIMVDTDAGYLRGWPQSAGGLEFGNRVNPTPAEPS
jgi:hypothetical protein